MLQFEFVVQILALAPCFAVSKKDSKLFPLSQVMSCLVFLVIHTQPLSSLQSARTLHLLLLPPSEHFSFHTSRVEDDARVIPRRRMSTSNTCHFLSGAYSHRRYNFHPRTYTNKYEYVPCAVLCFDQVYRVTYEALFQGESHVSP